MRLVHEADSRPLRLWTDDIEEMAMNQLRNAARLPFVHEHGLAAMADTHWGNGTSVGLVLPTVGAIIPAAVGVDIGCGMNAIRLSLTAGDLPDSLRATRHAIERGVPLGAGARHTGSKADDPGISGNLLRRGRDIFAKHPKVRTQHWLAQAGTLGSGNHFIELCLDENQDVWVMLHSGSRGIGNTIGRYFIEKAKRHMERLAITLPEAELAYLPEETRDFDDYIEALTWAQDYALENRRLMMTEVLRNLKRAIARPFEVTHEAINCHHNYTAREVHFGSNLWVTRKGAIRARSGDLGIIPGSMGQRSFIVRGLGNPDSYCSCSHGAGRAMSRTAALKQFTLADLVDQTQGVECVKDETVLDEIPGSYKNIDKVMSEQSDLVEVVHTLKQVMCVKGGNDMKKRRTKAS